MAAVAYTILALVTGMATFLLLAPLSLTTATLVAPFAGSVFILALSLSVVVRTAHTKISGQGRYVPDGVVWA